MSEDYSLIVTCIYFSVYATIFLIASVKYALQTHSEIKSRNYVKCPTNTMIDENKVKPFVKKMYPKSKEELERIDGAIDNVFPFDGLTNEQSEILIDAMFEKIVNKGDDIITEDNRGDYFYLIENGIYEVWESAEKQFTYESRGSFGETETLCNTKCTVKAVSDGNLWLVDNITFLHIIPQAVQIRQAVEISPNNVQYSVKHFFKRWAQLLWQKKNTYLIIIPYFFDQATDFGLVYKYYCVQNKYFFIMSITVIIAYRIISCCAVYKLTKNKLFVVWQMMEVLLIRSVWTNYQLHSEEPSNCQRYLQILEATFETAPQVVISTTFLLKTSNVEISYMVILSLIASFWTLTS
eukprot:210216_1